MQIISLTEQAYLNRDGDIEMTDAPIGCIELEVAKSDKNFNANFDTEDEINID